MRIKANQILSSILSIILALSIVGCGQKTGLSDVVITQKDTVETASTNEDAINDTTQGENTRSSAGDSEHRSTIPDGNDISVTMLNVGQGLSILIGQDGHYMLYDGGNRKASSYVVAYLKQHGVSSLDYLIASHYDEDHIAGLVGALNTTPVETALTPDYTADSKIYDSFITALNSSSAKVIHPALGDTFDFADAQFQVVGPKDYSYDGDNNNSICIRLTYGDFSCIMTGDAEQEAEDDMITSGLPIASDLYVVGHHGSSFSSSDEFVSAVQPSYAFISVGKDNKYGHPTKKTLNTLQKHNVQIFRSDDQDEVTCTSDGININFSAKPTTDMTSVTYQNDTSSSETNTNAYSASSPGTGGQTYILNTHTMKFHLPSCDSVQKMSEQNKEEVTTTRDELIKEGYSPCGSCKP